jgi:hypothetical protein
LVRFGQERGASSIPFLTGYGDPSIKRRIVMIDKLTWFLTKLTAKRLALRDVPYSVRQKVRILALDQGRQEREKTGRRWFK